MRLNIHCLNSGKVNQLRQNAPCVFFVLVGGAHLFADVSLLSMLISLLSSSSNNEDRSLNSNPSISYLI